MPHKNKAPKRSPENKASFGFQVVNVKQEGEQRIVAGLASTFGNIDRGGDVIERGAFTKTLKEKNGGKAVKFLYQHDWREVLGIIITLEERQEGLYIEAMFAKTTLGNDVYELAKIGALDSFSIGFRTIKSEWDEIANVRRIQEVELMEVSFVTFPMNEMARATAVKSMDEEELVAWCVDTFDVGPRKARQLIAAMREKPQKFVEVLALEDEEPEADEEGGEHSDPEAAEDDEKSRKMLDILHSLESIKAKK